MKKLIMVIIMIVILSTSIFASLSNPHPLHEVVNKDYQVGLVIEDNTVLGSDMRMYNLNTKDLIKGWYVAYNLETDMYYYITQDTAIEFCQK